MNLEWFTGLLVLVNSAQIIYQAWKRFKPEIKKLEAESDRSEAEADSEIVNAANVNLAGAELSARMLTQRIVELRQDLENEKKARREDAEYFRRRFREAERDARDYRTWAARLAKQVIEAGKIPIAFVPSIDGDSEKLRSISEDDRKRDEKEDMIEENRIETKIEQSRKDV